MNSTVFFTTDEDVTKSWGDSESDSNQTVSENIFTEDIFTEDSSYSFTQEMTNTTVDQDSGDGNPFLNMETSTVILVGGLFALVIIVSVVVFIVVIYIRCKSKSRRQVNVALEQRGEPEAISGDTAPLT